MVDNTVDAMWGQSCQGKTVDQRSRPLVAQADAGCGGQPHVATRFGLTLVHQCRQPLVLFDDIAAEAKVQLRVRFTVEKMVEIDQRLHRCHVGTGLSCQPALCSGCNTTEMMLYHDQCLQQVFPLPGPAKALLQQALRQRLIPTGVRIGAGKQGIGCDRVIQAHKNRGLIRLLGAMCANLSSIVMAWVNRMSVSVFC